MMNADNNRSVGGHELLRVFVMELALGCLLLIISPTQVLAQSWFPAFPGAKYEQRKQAYIGDQGRAWQQWFPGAMIHAIWAWLERPAGNEARISEEIGYLASEGNPMGWKNAWWDGDHRTPIFAIRIYLQYYKQNKVITDADAQKLKEKLRGVAVSPGVWCAVANYQFRYLVTAYLYTSLIEDVGQVGFPQPSNDRYACPQPFTYNGRSYVGGNFYDAKTIYGDYLSYKIDQWLKKGDQEDFGLYYFAQVHSMAALADFAPDPTVKRKAAMLFDFSIFNWAVDFSANHPAGGHGRNYIKDEEPGRQEFPWAAFFDLYGKADIGWKWNYADAYVFEHRFPQLLTDIVEMKNEGDDYYRIIRGHTPSLSEPPYSSVFPISHRYDYVTRNYNLGGTNFGTGWELNVDAPYVPMKMWMETSDKPNGGHAADDRNDPNYPNVPLFNLGNNGYQHENAVFFAAYGYLQQWLGDNTWDEQSTESGWKFFRRGKVSVAAKIGSRSGALEVRTIGVDYPSYEHFKTAINTKAVLTPDYFETSKGVKITKGYVDYGSDFSQLPFDRLEVWEGHVGRNDQTKIVDWNNNVMTVSKYGKTITYDFNTWIVYGDLSNTLDLIPPASPRGVQVKPQ